MYRPFRAKILNKSILGRCPRLVCQPLSGATEDTTNRGRIDLTLKLDDKVYIIEFKLADNSNQNSALQQIKQQRYFEKYQDSGATTIYLIGVVFDTEAKNIGRFDWELLS